MGCTRDRREHCRQVHPKAPCQRRRHVICIVDGPLHQSPLQEVHEGSGDVKRPPVAAILCDITTFATPTGMALPQCLVLRAHARHQRCQSRLYRGCVSRNQNKCASFHMWGQDLSTAGRWVLGASSTVSPCCALGSMLSCLVLLDMLRYVQSAQHDLQLLGLGCNAPQLTSPPAWARDECAPMTSQSLNEGGVRTAQIVTLRSCASVTF